MLDKVRNYINDVKCEINIIENSIHVINYKKIITFTDDNIILDVNNKNLIVKGDNLVISKLLENEVLIKGDIKITEIR